MRLGAILKTRIFVFIIEESEIGEYLAGCSCMVEQDGGLSRSLDFGKAGGDGQLSCGVAVLR